MTSRTSSSAPLLRALDDQLFEQGAEGAHPLLGSGVEGEQVDVEHGVVHGEVVVGGVRLERLHRLGADAALRDVDDAGDRLAVKGVVDHAQIGEQVLDLLALVEAGSPRTPCTGCRIWRTPARTGG